jgi:hypothetical protein
MAEGILSDEWQEMHESEGTYNNMTLDAIPITQHFRIQDTHQQVYQNWLAAPCFDIKILWKHCASDSMMRSTMGNWVDYYLLGAPALADTREHHLLRVISDECNKIINNLSEVTIETSADHGLDHSCAQWV